MTTSFAKNRLRRNRDDGRKSTKSCDEVFAKLLAKGITPEQLYEAVTTQVRLGGGVWAGGPRCGGGRPALWL